MGIFLSIALSIAGFAIGLIVGFNITSLVARIAGHEYMRNSRPRFWLGLLTMLLAIAGSIIGAKIV